MDAANDDAQLTDWLQRTSAGDVMAFAALFDATAVRLLARVRRVVGDHHAEEVLCDVFRHVWKTAAEYDAANDALGWLVQLTRARAIDRVAREAICGGHANQPAAQAREIPLDR